MRWLGVVMVVVAGAARAVAGEPQADIGRLFPQVADVFVDRPGLSRLVVPPAVLAACRPDLSDLRLLDRAGREVPFLTDSGVGRNEVREASVIVPGDILDVRRDAATHSESYDIKAPASPPGGGGWFLVLNTTRPEFECTVEVGGTRADGVAVPVLPRTSLFRLPQLAAEQSRFALPPSDAERLTVTISNAPDGFLQPTINFEAVRRLDTAARATLPLREVARDSADGQTVIELERPPGIVPDVIRLDTGTPAFSRAVRVVDVQATGRELPLGQGNLFRVPSQPPIETRELPVGPARGERLRVEIRDQDSPPLADVRVTAVVQQPVLIFSLPPAADGQPAGSLAFGGGRAGAARYDLAGLLSADTRRVTGDAARIATWLYDPAELGSARLGALRANAKFDQTPALAFAMHPSDAITPAVFAYRQALTVTPSGEGLSQLRLPAEAEAVARPDLGDLRIVDADGRQWPYLLERHAAMEWIELQVAAPSRRAHTSRYALGLPAAPLTVDRLLLDIDAAYFHRPYRLITSAADGTAGSAAEGAERVLAQGDLSRPLRTAGPVLVPFRGERIDSLTLLIEDGDDAPLAVRGARARRQASDLYLAAPAGQYFLLVGYPDAAAPRYELAAVRDVVLAVRSAPVVSGVFAKNPTYSTRARLLAGSTPARLAQRLGVWAVLLLAVAVLAGLTLRVVRREPRPGGGSPP